MKHFIEGSLYRCLHDYTNGEWMSKCHFTKGKKYKAYSEYALIDDYDSPIGFPSIFDTNKYFVEDNEAV